MALFHLHPLRSMRKSSSLADLVFFFNVTIAFRSGSSSLAWFLWFIFVFVRIWLVSFFWLAYGSVRVSGIAASTLPDESHGVRLCPAAVLRQISAMVVIQGFVGWLGNLWFLCDLKKD